MNQKLIKDTWYLWGKNSKNRQLLDILTCNSANILANSHSHFDDPLFLKFTTCNLTSLINETNGWNSV